MQWGLCWRDIDVLQSYREQIHEKLKCMAQPYKMEVLTEVGWILCWRDRELWLFYRQLRWRMVKMVRNAYEMAIPEKKCRFFFEKNRWKNEKLLEMGRQKSFSSSDYRVLKQFFETNRLVISSGGQTWLKNSFWGVRLVKNFPKIFQISGAYSN